jgi:hypothetical protein
VGRDSVCRIYLKNVVIELGKSGLTASDKMKFKEFNENAALVRE